MDAKPAYKQPRYYRTCCRCGNYRHAHAAFPDGHICRECLIAALKAPGTCPACGRDRRLIGRRDDGAAVCRECAGITRDFSCRLCGYEGEFCVARTCLRCENARRLTELLDDGTGQPRAELRPLIAWTRDDPDPRRTRAWVRRPRNRELLADLGAGRAEVSHEALAARDDWARASYMRHLLVVADVLPPADMQLTAHEGWLRVRLARLEGHPHLRLLREFGLWHQLSRMRATAARRPLRATAARYAQVRFITAEVFLDWITERGLRPAQVRQADIDAFYNSHKTYQQQAVRSFLTWAMDAGHIPRGDAPVLRFGKGPGITQDERLALIRRFAEGQDGLPLYLRVAACLMLLYAQPLSRILRLTLGDLIRDDDGLSLRFGTPPSPVPEPFAAMIGTLEAEGADTGMLFPGRYLGRPRGYDAVIDSLAKAGLPMRNARTASLRQLVVQVPAPVVADALGFHQTTTTRQLAAAGGTWSRYAATRAARPAPTPRKKASQ